MASFYFVIGVCLGMYMSMAHVYTLSSVHAHVNLLDWVSMAIIGCIYLFFPNAAATGLAKIQFWLYQIAFPIMMIGLAFVVHQNETFVPVVAVGGAVLVLSVILFAINVLKNIRA